jgi:hypothetical protein
VDLQWILDKFIETGKIDAAQTVRIDQNEGDIRDLKRLYDRVLKLETNQNLESEQERVSPAHRQVFVSAIAAVASIAAAAASFIALFALHH